MLVYHNSSSPGQPENPTGVLVTQCLCGNYKHSNLYISDEASVSSLDATAKEGWRTREPAKMPFIQMFP